MGYQPRIKSSRNTAYQNKKPLREKNKNKKNTNRQYSRQGKQEKIPVLQAEFIELTLKRLHTLGAQKFGTSPFSTHFTRWLTNVKTILDEFETYFSIGVDEQFKNQCAEILTTIESQLDAYGRKEANAEQETKKLSYCKSFLNQINAQHALAIGALKAQKANEIKRLNSLIVQLKSDQDRIIRLKTGFWRGVSKKEREQQELVVIEALNEKQLELELVVLDFKEKQRALWEQFERRREPIQKQLHMFQNKVQAAETDGSLEERWFACEALVDVVNGFLQRKIVDVMDLNGFESKNAVV
ncbi:MAG: hypothetical protein LBQ98_02155 [Nitrososphaerota archaeon]|jgi:hypothetical protein|nr:hypothetical protein [Nitrososphaerota archaeon]